MSGPTTQDRAADPPARGTRATSAPRATGRRAAGRGLLGNVPMGWLLLGLAGVLALAVGSGVMWGSVSVPAGEVGRIVLARGLGIGMQDAGWAPGVGQIVWELRLPRVLLAAVVGATLTVVGVVIQAVVRNVLADPYVLGVSSGASVGATTVLLLGAFGGFGAWALTGAAFLGALVAVVVVFAVAVERGRLDPLRLVLTGVAMSFMFSAMTSFLVFQADPRAARLVMFWLLGSFGRATWSLLVLPSLLLAAGMAFLLLQGRSLNAMTLGDDAATSLGLDPGQLRRLLFVAASLLTGGVVAVSGAIGFVGLMLPHVVRLLVGSDHRRVLPAGALLGAAFMIWGDLLARTLVSPQEMPIGVITAFIGGPVFVLLVRRGAYSFGGGR